MKHEIDGYIWDTVRHTISKIKDIKSHTFNINLSLHKKVYSLVLHDDGGFTQYLTIKQLDEIYPYVGKDFKIAELLYGNNKNSDIN